MSLFEKILLIFSCLTMISFMVSTQLLDCFVPFAINDTISEKLNGNVLNVINLKGWGALGC